MDLSRHIQFFILLCSLTCISVQAETWNDISRLNPEIVSGVVRVKEAADVVSALKSLPADTKVVISGTRHSQGGHIVYPDAVVLDMTGFNKIVSISPKDKIVIVQSGATWAVVQEAVNEFGLSVKVMQSSNIFSVGGSLSANVHGRDPRFGPIIETVRSIKMVLAGGKVITADRSNNPDLFYAAIGGYGLLGVILEAEIELTDNAPLVKTTDKTSIKGYAQVASNLADDLSLHYGRCSFVPGKAFLKECYSTNFTKIDNGYTVSKLEPERNIKRNSLIFGASRKSYLGKVGRWALQKLVLDKPGERVYLDRNPAMQPAVRFLSYNSPKDTDILQEYFIPIERFPEFFSDLGEALENHDVNLLSITLRYLKENRESYLSYSTKNMIAVVLYVNIELNEKSIKSARAWTRDVVDLSLRNDGTYYLTYQEFPTLEQFKSAYPNWEKFMKIKCKYDSGEIFSSKFYEQYLKSAMQSGNQMAGQNGCR